MATVAGGDTHGLALTVDDAVWSWGGNASGQLGEGSTTSRPLAGPVGGPDFAWGAVRPVFSPGAGPYGTP